MMAIKNATRATKHGLRKFCESLLGVACAYLPERWRRRLSPPGDARTNCAISAVIELLVALGLQIANFFYFTFGNLGAIIGAGIAKNGPLGLNSEHVQMGMGIINWMAFMIQPRTIVLNAFFLEGGVRLIASVSAAEACGAFIVTLPIWLGERLHRRLTREPDEQQKLFVDEEGRACRLTTERPMHEWTGHQCFHFHEHYYEIDWSSSDATDTPCRYELVPAQGGDAIRRIAHWNEELKKFIN